MVFELLDNQGKAIGRQTLQAGGSWGLRWSERPRVEKSDADRKYRYGNVYIEAGFQAGLPLSSKATVSSGSEFPGSPFRYEYSDFRAEMDYGPVFGFGIVVYDFSMGVRFTTPLTKLDRYGTIKTPAIGSFTLTYDFL